MSDSENTLSIKRFYPASTQRVFEAWTRPELLREWFMPDDIESCDAEMDVREGGSYTLILTSKSGEVYTTTGEFLEIVPNETIRFTWGWEAEVRQESIVTVELVEAKGGTELTLTHTGLPTPESLEHHRGGWTGCVESLARFLG